MAMRMLLAIGAVATLSAPLAACGADVQGEQTGGAAANGMGGAGGLAGGAGGASGAAGGGPPDVCAPGIPRTSQIPRLLNRHYQAVVRDLLGVTGVGTDDQKVSELLVGDSDGPMTPDAWRIYLDVGAQIAREVMSGPNRANFITCDAAEVSCMEATIRSFGRKAFRRPLTDAEVARFQKLGATMPAGTADEIAEATLQAFLVSPSFLMVPELATSADPSGQGIQLSSHEVAMRLSLLLWGSIPDETLSAAADADQLTSQAQILTQAQRMIAVREKSGPLLGAFHREWAQMNNQSGHWWKIDHDTARYPLYSPDKKTSWQAELDAFFEDVAFSNGSFRDLLTSGVAFVNRDNAAIYGLDPAMFGSELTRTELDPAQRPGFMTRAGFLGSYSGYDATSPILRGAFITVYMLGVDTGPPIPGATMMTVDGDFQTQRAYVEALTQPDTCKGCHTTINPPGFALEGFDAIGKLQTVDPRGGAIDASVTTATVDFGAGKQVEISSPAQLMQEIAQTPKALELYAQAWVAYAFGRAPNGNDRCVVEQLRAKLAGGDYSILNLLADLTQADAFRLRAQVTP